MPEYFPLPDANELSIRKLSRKILERSLVPHVEEDELKFFFRRKAFQELAQKGLVSLMIPKEWGGGGRPSIEYYAFIEELARVSVSMAITVGVTNLTMGGLLNFGSDSQKKIYIPKLASGEWIGAFSLSEPASGSDAASLKLSATKTSGGYLLKGTKLWCSSAGIADIYLVVARTAADKIRGITTFIVHKDAQGFSIGKQEKKLGLRSSPLAEIVFDNCLIPESQRLGKEGEGLKVAFSQLDLGRIGIGACALGSAMEALETTLRYRYAAEPKGWEFSEGEQQMLASSYSQIQAAKGLMIATAMAKDSHVGLAQMASHFKSFTSDVAMNVASVAVEMMGPDGYVEGSRVERIFRDVKALQIVEGTNQIQRMLLARHLKESCED